MRSTGDDQGEPGMVAALTAATADADPRDRALVALALAYAGDITGMTRCVECGGPRGGDLAKLGPALLAALESLQLSPRARKAVTGAGPQQQRPRLDDDLAARRRARGDRPPSVDTGAP